ncbi:hypothetical protein OHAE_5482 [Ochrobactrum soli]|uniref:Uncharacterized protein n=1 Tax=Ochrobactrum soli TaxID=2448455 RepID=A0A2P9HE72_9HYPH|nr:hypothetical protein OHAE_5482 [[Ochrobactrum] soli]
MGYVAGKEYDASLVKLIIVLAAPKAETPGKDPKHFVLALMDVQRSLRAGRKYNLYY